MSEYLSNWPKRDIEWLSALGARRRFALFFAIGALGALGHPPVAWPVFTLASLLFAFFLRPWSLGARVSGFAGWAYGLGYFAVTLHWIVEPFLVDIARHGWMAPFALLLMAGGLALFWGVAFAVGGRWRSGLVLVLAWSVAEFGRAHVFGGFPWGMHVTAFVDVLAYQGAALLGPQGLALTLFLAVWAVSQVSVLLAGLGTACLLALSLLSMPAAPPPSGTSPLVRVVQPNAIQRQKWDPAFAPVFLARKLEATAAEPEPALILWPETALTSWLENSAGLLAEAGAQGRGAELLIGANSFRGRRAYNALAHVRGGAVVDIYDKAHLVPFGEYMPLSWLLAGIDIFGFSRIAESGFAAGAGPAVFDVTGIGPVQPLICYESLFAHEVRRAPERPRLIAVVTNDAWFGELGGPAQHLMQSQARAIELGLPVARSANTGISAIIDARGRVVASLALGEAGHVDAPLPDARAPTLYTRFGDLPFFAVWAVLLGAHIRTRRRIAD